MVLGPRAHAPRMHSEPWAAVAASVPQGPLAKTAELKGRWLESHQDGLSQAESPGLFGTSL